MNRWYRIIVIFICLCVSFDLYAWSWPWSWSKKSILSAPIQVDPSIFPLKLPKIDRMPPPDPIDKGKLNSIPVYDQSNKAVFQIDLRGADLSGLNLECSIDDLVFASFDDRTEWPNVDNMPALFNPNSIRQYGMEPGLNIENLHSQGITGNGISIAIIDQPLLVGNQEYSKQLQLYEEVNIDPNSGASMHGAAVASIAVGKNVGVAPDARLFFIGTSTFDSEDMGNCKYPNGGEMPSRHFKYYARAINRLLEINKLLPSDQKIKVLSMSIGWSDSQCDKETDLFKEAIENAKQNGIFVIFSSIEKVYGSKFKFHGLGRLPLANSMGFSSYEPGLFWEDKFYEEISSGSYLYDRLLIPMDSRTVASQGGDD